KQLGNILGAPAADSGEQIAAVSLGGHHHSAADEYLAGLFLVDLAAGATCPALQRGALVLWSCCHRSHSHRHPDFTSS
ncbi:hypothetical protein, partial [Rhizobium leguminosarum]|uniref:hypothetical protein n=1 Tax=Rhizobium leguminosarum TaxID=384 RepID=UPI003F9E0040